MNNHISILDSSSKRHWNELNKIAPLGKKSASSSTGHIILKKDDGTNIEGAEVCKFINDFFISVGADLSSRIQTNNQDYVLRASNEPEVTMMDWGTISDNEVLLLILSLETHKNSNIDDISSYLLKECLICAVEEVIELFRSILSSGMYPDSWKPGTVVPLFKGGNKFKVSNYRPVSLLAVIGKLLEKLLHRRKLTFLDSKNYFTISQGGFRPKMSTTDTI